MHRENSPTRNIYNRNPRQNRRIGATALVVGPGPREIALGIGVLQVNETDATVAGRVVVARGPPPVGQ